MTNIQYNLIKLRKDKNLKQREIAERLGIKQATYQAYEEGRSYPKVEVMVKIEDLHGITFRTLVTEKISHAIR